MKASDEATTVAGVHLEELPGDARLTAEAIVLLEEYGHYMFSELGLSAGKESFFSDLKNFPASAYLPPAGSFVLAMAGNSMAGCVGIKRFDKESCEMKRMFIRPAFRGKGIGRLLFNHVFDWCRKAGDKRILLDTNIEMKEALVLYRRCGFKEIKPYCINENAHPVFMEYLL